MPLPETLNSKIKHKNTNKALGPCPIERGMRLIGGKWKASILWHLKDGPLRFNELARQLRGASKKMVAQRLDEMQSSGLIARTVISAKPLAVSYQTTEFGQSALGVLETLHEWAFTHRV